MKIRCFIILLTLGIGFSINAQTPYSSDNYFIASYQHDFQFLPFTNGTTVDTLLPEVSLLSETSNCVRVMVENLNFDTIVYLMPRKELRLKLPQNKPIYPLEINIKRGIQIKSTFPLIAKYNVNIGGGMGNGLDFATMAESQSLISYKNAGVEYIANYTRGNFYHFLFSDEGASTSHTLVSFADDNNIELNITRNTSVDSAGFEVVSIRADSTFIIELDKGESFSLYCYLQAYSGTYFVGSTFISKDYKPFQLFTTGFDNAGRNSTNIGGFQGTFFETLKSLTFFGTKFHAAPIDQQNGNLYSFVAQKDSTEIFFNGLKIIELDSLSHFDTCVAGPILIESTKPINGYLAPCKSEGANSNFLSPFSVTLSSDREIVKRSLFGTLNEPDTNNHYVVGLVTKTAHTSQLKLDGQFLTGVNFTPFTADPIWSWVNFEIDTGVHVLEGDSGFHAIHYTWYPFDSLNPFQVFPAYGYNLPESTLLPPDSFYFNILPPQGNWQYFQDYDTVVCTGDLLNFKPNVARFTTWQWNFGDGTDTLQKIDYEAPGTVTHSYSQPGLYWVVVQDSAGCTSGDSVLIEVVDGPNTQFGHTATQSCEGVWVQLQNETQGASNYTWQLPNGEISTQENPGFFYEGGDPLTVTLTASNSQCSQTESQAFTPQVQNFNADEIPNVFTPNADGENDCFFIPNSLGFAECYQLAIYNRWGGEVFSSKDPSQCWGGDVLSDGVYFYSLILGKETYKGEIHLLR